MQWMSLGLVVVLSGATILTQSPRFVMLKPSIVHFAIAAVMLRRGWMIRYLPEIVLQNVPEPTIVAAGYAWAALLAVLGLSNLIIALHFDFVTWAWYAGMLWLGSTLRENAGPLRIMATSLTGSIAFFLVSNFAVCIHACLRAGDAFFARLPG